jgi:hypothetical protein
MAAQSTYRFTSGVLLAVAPVSIHARWFGEIINRASLGDTSLSGARGIWRWSAGWRLMLININVECAVHPSRLLEATISDACRNEHDGRVMLVTPPAFLKR